MASQSDSSRLIPTPACHYWLGWYLSLSLFLSFFSRVCECMGACFCCWSWLIASISYDNIAHFSMHCEIPVLLDQRTDQISALHRRCWMLHVNGAVDMTYEKNEKFIIYICIFFIDQWPDCVVDPDSLYELAQFSPLYCLLDPW